MAGTAKTSQFVLSTATVMLGPVADLHKLTPATHSIGLVKNFTYTEDPEFKELTQGLNNDVVMSVKTGSGARAAMEVYEYTARNLAYAAGLDGSVVAYDPLTALFTTSAAPTGTTVTLSAAPTGLTAGDYIFIQGGYDDLVHIGKIASIATNTITLATTHAIPAGMTFPAASRVGKVLEISAGVDTLQATMAAKVTAIMPDTHLPVVLLFPKVKITRGLSVSFSSDNFSNMPFEFTPYASVMADPHYAEFGPRKFKMFTR